MLTRDEIAIRALEGDPIDELLLAGLMAGEPVGLAELLRQSEPDADRADRWN